MYQTLGCFHSLQPLPSPFKTPQLPCLTPIGFARWQTIQLLLCPEEHVGFIQKAVQKWNVPMPTGGTYPKYIPKDVFPDRPDEEMEKWHRMVTGRLNEQNYSHVRRIKNSPYQSPHPEPYDRRDGYFSGTQVGQPARHSRSSSRDDDHLSALNRRRSSVPDFPSPVGERGSHWDSQARWDAKKPRSVSAQRSSPKPPKRQRSQTTNGPPGHQKPSSDGPPSRRHGTAPPESSGRRSSGGHNVMAYRSPNRTPSTVNEDSGSDGSSEASQGGRRPRKSDEERKGRRSSFWPPAFLKSSSSHKRRHSSDSGNFRASDPRSGPPQPPRPEYYQPRAIKPAPPPPSQVPTYRGGAAPQWHNPNWENDTPNSVPATPTQTQKDPRVPAIRYPDQTNFEPLTRESSSGSDHRHRSSDWERGHGQRRQVPPPPNNTTVTGVSGRRYPTADPMSPVERSRTHPPRGNMAFT